MNTGTAQSLAPTGAASSDDMAPPTLENWRDVVASMATTASYWDWVQEHLPPEVVPVVCDEILRRPAFQLRIVQCAFPEG